MAGTVVALALIPESIAFSIIAGVDPTVGLYSSFCIAVVTAFVGGRPGLISAATGSMSLLMITLVKNYGLQYLFAATILTGILQILFGVGKLSRQMKYIPNAVMSGFVNALRPNFYGTTASTHQCAHSSVPNGGDRAGDYLYFAEVYNRYPLTLSGDRAADCRRHFRQD